MVPAFVINKAKARFAFIVSQLMLPYFVQPSMRPILRRTITFTESPDSLSKEQCR